MKKRKRRLLAGAVFSAVLCWGCGRTDAAAEAAGEIGKAQEIRIFEGGELVQTLEGQEERENFIQSLALGDWEPGALPEDAQPDGQFVCIQEETLKLGQNEEDRKLQELCRMDFYREESCILLEMGKLELVFEIPEDAAGALEQYL